MWRKYVSVLIASAFVVGVVGASDFVAEDLLLASWAGIDDGSPAYTGLVCEGIAEYWFGANGYPAFWEDLTGDGRVNERDVEAHAQEQGEFLEGYYATFDPSVGIHDCWLLGTAVWYFGEAYPDQFLMKVYDDTIEQENLQVKGKSLDLQAYADQGVEVELHGNASRYDYVRDLQQGAAVIVGLGNEGDYNTYFVGRSFDDRAQGGLWPVDFVDTADDPFTAGIQGAVLDTFMRQGDPWWYAQYGTWVPVEFMLSILPVRGSSVADGGTPPGGRDVSPPPGGEGDCSGDCYTTQVSTPEGDFVVEECEQRNVGGVDIYTYEVTNIDHCGLDWFAIPTNGLVATNIFEMSGCWIGSPGPTYWSWSYDDAFCAPGGLQPGQSNLFGVEVPSPTTDIKVTGEASMCVEACVKPEDPGLPDVSGDWLEFCGGTYESRTVQQSGNTFSWDGYCGSSYYKATATFTGDCVRIPVGTVYRCPISIEYQYEFSSDTVTAYVDAYEACEPPYPDEGFWGSQIHQGTVSTILLERPCFKLPCVGAITVVWPYEFVTCGPFGEEGQKPPAGDCSVSPTWLDFDEVELGSSDTKSFTITNSGGGTLSGAISLTGANCGQFSVVPSSYNLSPSDPPLVVIVTFSPSSTGHKMCTVDLDGQGLCPSVTLEGDGKEAYTPPPPTCPDLVITSLSACYEHQGIDSVTVVVITGTVENQGTGTATNSGIDFTVGTDCWMFPMWIIGTNLGTITPGQSKPFSASCEVPDPNDCTPFGVSASVGCSETECNETNNDAWTQANSWCP
jgi:hypothetical protein